MDVLKIAFLMLEFLGFGLILRRLLGIPLSIAPPIIVSIVVLVLYCLNFFISLKPISILLHVSGILAFLFYAGLVLKHKLKFASAIPINKSYILYFISALLIVLGLFFLDRGGEFRAWDEFSHWGTVIRAVYEANTFILDPNPLYCQDYPPGTALFSYYILSVLGYTEGNAYFSFSVLLLCYAAPIIIAGLKKGIGVGIFAGVLVFYLVFALGNGWASVLIDHVLSLALAGVIVSYFILQKYSRTLFFIPLMLSALVLFKHVGSSLAIFAAVVCAVDWVILRSTTAQGLNPHFKDSPSSYYKDIVWLLSLFLLPFVISFSWKYYVSFIELRQTWGTMSITHFFVRSLTCCTTSREIDVAGNFFATFFDLGQPYNQSASLGGFLSEAAGRLNLLKLFFSSSEFAVGKVILTLSVIGTTASFFFSTVQRRIRFVILNVELTIGAVLYSGSLLLAYLYGFSDYEAKILTSFQRYHNVFLLAWSLILVYVTIELYSDLVTATKRYVLSLIVVVFSFWSLYSVTPNISSYIKHGAWTASEQRLEVKKFIETVKSKIPENARVYIAWYGSNGWEFWMMKYELTPKITNLFCFSLGPKLNSEDMYTCEFQTELFKNYDYFIIGKGLQVLHKNYGPVFEGVPLRIDQGLLKIKNTETGLKLIYVPE